MSEVRNILFIMCDQLRADYLGCAGHPTIRTPNIDRLAAMGVRFERAYCQSPLCGPSRMSFYTGRYAVSHGATFNNVPLPISEWTLGEYLRPLGLRTAVIGKTHMQSDANGMRRTGLDPNSPDGVLMAECGFEPYARDDGLHPGVNPNPRNAYIRYLKEKGYQGPNPWHDYANSAEGPDGEILSGWRLRNSPFPARIDERDSETAFCTQRAMDFISECGEQAWCLHLSFIKPHWPYIAPSPYHDIYSSKDVIPANRVASEMEVPNPVYAAFMQHEDSRSFQSQTTRETVIPTYMGLITQIDDHLGRLLDFLQASGKMQETLIVFTSDHGDYLGDHWLGEKELFHEESVRIPCIIFDPSEIANGTRGSVEHRLTESIDLIPTFLDYFAAAASDHRLEGRSLKPLLHGLSPAWRDAVFSETDYAHREARAILGRPVDGARGFMIRNELWKYIFYEGFLPQLFDLQNDPQELNDVASDPAWANVRQELHEGLFHWLRNRRVRTTMPNEGLAERPKKARERGLLIGAW